MESLHSFLRRHFARKCRRRDVSAVFLGYPFTSYFRTGSGSAIVLNSGKICLRFCEWQPKSSRKEAARETGSVLSRTALWEGSIFIAHDEVAKETGSKVVLQKVSTCFHISNRPLPFHLH